MKNFVLKNTQKIIVYIELELAASVMFMCHITLNVPMSFMLGLHYVPGSHGSHGSQ